jgi:hypothetical protein
MKLCIECGKKIGILNCYNHPVKGKKHTVCGDCFTIIDKFLTLWREYVLSDSLNKVSSDFKFNFEWEKKFTTIKNIYEDFRKSTIH